MDAYILDLEEVAAAATVLIAADIKYVPLEDMAQLPMRAIYNILTHEAYGGSDGSRSNILVVVIQHSKHTHDELQMATVILEADSCSLDAALEILEVCCDRLALEPGEAESYAGIVTRCVHCIAEQFEKVDLEVCVDKMSHDAFVMLMDSDVLAVESEDTVTLNSSPSPSPSPNN